MKVVFLVTVALAVAAGEARPENPLVHMVPEPDQCFMSVVSQPFAIDVRSSKESLHRSLGKGDILCANGDLIAVQIRFGAHRVLRYNAQGLRKLVKGSGVSMKGGWLIGAQGLEYVSNERYQHARSDE